MVLYCVSVFHLCTRTLIQIIRKSTKRRCKVSFDYPKRHKGNYGGEQMSSPVQCRVRDSTKSGRELNYIGQFKLSSTFLKSGY